MLLVIVALVATLTSVERAEATPVEWLTQDAFTHGTYIIDRPGIYRLAEDISFNPNSPAVLDEALTSGAISPELAAGLSLSAPVDAYRAGWPLPTQLLNTVSSTRYSPGGPTDPRYDPSAYGVGFFAAISIAADGVVLDLDGHRIEQSAEHALLQRFFSVIELADQPFIPAQGPSGFGDELVAATNVTVKNGVIGRSAHHGIHGNGNTNITIKNVDFVGYEVAAVALNGVDGLTIRNASAVNRKDVPVLGTFSSARFISPYVDHLARTDSATTLIVEGRSLAAVDIQSSLRDAINRTHHDVKARGFIDPVAHPDEYALFHNPRGLDDGNSYSFVVNSFGVAVNGFPSRPDGPDKRPARNVRLDNVRVINQESFVNEIPAVDAVGGPSGPVIDPVGAVFQIRNEHPLTGEPITISTTDHVQARYVGNAVANAQAFVAKAAAHDDFNGSHLDVSRTNITPTMLRWVEGEPASEYLADIGASYLCNGDSMFHVNKGAIGFKLDAVDGVVMRRTSVRGLVNFGKAGSELCGDYSDGKSHPAATLLGYGGSAVRAYTLAGSSNVVGQGMTARRLVSLNGPAIGFDLLTNSTTTRLVNSVVFDVVAGSAVAGPIMGPNGPAHATGFHVASEASQVSIKSACVGDLDGHSSTHFLLDHSGGAIARPNQIERHC